MAAVATMERFIFMFGLAWANLGCLGGGGVSCIVVVSVSSCSCECREVLVLGGGLGLEEGQHLRTKCLVNSDK